MPFKATGSVNYESPCITRNLINDTDSSYSLCATRWWKPHDPTFINFDSVYQRVASRTYEQTRRLYMPKSREHSSAPQKRRYRYHLP